jgi:hypothetical protein
MYRKVGSKKVESKEEEFVGKSRKVMSKKV